MVKFLTYSNCLLTFRDNLVSRGYPVFSMKGNNNVLLTFHFDSKVYAGEEGIKTVRALNLYYFLN